MQRANNTIRSLLLLALCALSGENEKGGTEIGRKGEKEKEHIEEKPTARLRSELPFSPFPLFSQFQFPLFSPSQGQGQPTVRVNGVSA